MKNKIRLSYKLRATVFLILSSLYLLSCSVDEAGQFSSDSGKNIPVTLSVQMSGSTFETSTEIVPMQMKSNSEDYDVIKFTGQSTLIILKRTGSGWVVE